MKQHFYLKYEAKSEQTFVLNLDDDFSPFSDITSKNVFFLKHNKFTFLGGEPHFQILTDPEIVKHGKDLIITQRFNNVGDIFNIVLAVDAARRMGIKNISLVLPYFPAARQDRVCNEGEPLTIKVFADIINGCNFDKVLILTPHSEVTPALLNNVVVIDDLQFAKTAVETVARYTTGVQYAERINIICPDAGAGKRIGKIASYLSNQFEHIKFDLIRCEKVRDVKNGTLIEFHVQSDDLGKYPCIIFDDITSRSGTFVGLANKLKELNCGQLALSISHADCVEGLEIALEHFDFVFTTNSKKDYGTLIDNAKLHILDITI